MRRILLICTVTLFALLGAGCGKKQSEQTPIPEGTPDTFERVSDIDVIARENGFRAVVVIDDARLYDSPVSESSTAACHSGDLVWVFNLVDTVRNSELTTMFFIRDSVRNTSGWVAWHAVHMFDESETSFYDYLYNTYIPSEESETNPSILRTKTASYSPEFFARALANPNLRYMSQRLALKNGGQFAVALYDSVVIRRGARGDTMIHAGERVIALPESTPEGEPKPSDYRVVMFNGDAGRCSRANLFLFEENSWNEYIYGTAVPPEITLKGEPESNAVRLFSHEFLTLAARNQRSDSWYKFGEKVLTVPAENESTDEPDGN